MNFKTIVSKVNLHAGLQGTVVSVEATDYQQYIAEAVRSAWVDLQNYREDWKFMWKTLTFNTVADQHEYTESFLLSAEDHGVAKWKKDSFFRNSVKQDYYEFQEYWDHQEDWEGDQNPGRFTVREYAPKSLIVPSPVNGDVIRADYYRTPQELTSNTDVPILPEEFHYIIVWKALEDVAAYLGNPSIYERHSFKGDLLLNKLLRSQVPHKKINIKPFYRKRTY